MTWMSCGICHQCPCACQRTHQPFPSWYGDTAVPFTATFGSPHLSDADVERIADRVVAKLREAKP